jgi:uncharacterized heparinase superfamily protein
MLFRAHRCWSTVRHLRPVQIRYQIWYRLRNRVRSSGVDLRRDTPALRERAGAWVQPLVKTTSWLGAGTFRFLNETRNNATVWEAPTDDRLWAYNLHYFDYLGQATPPGSGVLDGWIARHPPGIVPAWEPYPLSLRVVNWIKRHLAGAPLDDRQRTSLAQQVDWLTHNLEYHLLGNHLWANAKALVFGGLFFSETRARSWHERGLSLLRSQLREQILADGGHFERCPMYHAIALEDVLDLINILRLYGEDPALESDLQATAARMLNWLRAMSHPDGQIPFFNDSALGIAAAPIELADYARRLGLSPSPPFSPSSVGPSAVLRDSGYARLRSAPWLVLADVGSIGPAYQPGHAHAEALSFEISTFGTRCLINSGISTYHCGRDRTYQRSSAAHNCLLVDGRDSSEVWASHRVGRRARVRIVEASARRLVGVHDGYSRLRGVGEHRRTWLVQGTGLTVSDRLAGTGQRDLLLLFHVHPDWTADPSGSREVCLRQGRHRVYLALSTLEVKVDRTLYYPEFGKAVPNCTVTAYGRANLPCEIVTTIKAERGNLE